VLEKDINRVESVAELALTGKCVLVTLLEHLHFGQLAVELRVLGFLFVDRVCEHFVDVLQFIVTLFHLTELF